MEITLMSIVLAVSVIGNIILLWCVIYLSRAINKAHVQINDTNRKLQEFLGIIAKVTKDVENEKALREARKALRSKHTSVDAAKQKKFADRVKARKSHDDHTPSSLYFGLDSHLYNNDSDSPSRSGSYGNYDSNNDVSSSTGSGSTSSD